MPAPRIAWHPAGFMASPNSLRNMPRGCPFADRCAVALPGCAGAGRPDRYPEPILADDYLQQRLREIKLL